MEIAWQLPAIIRGNNQRLAMPTRLPNKARAKAIHNSDVGTNRVRENKGKGIDWLALCALSLGFSAVVLAAIANFVGNDPAGATAILFGAAVIIAAFLHADGKFRDRH
jgi:hypothetical protein